MESDRTREGIEDDRQTAEAAHDPDGPATVADTIGAHVQDVLRGIMEFVRGREAPEHDHDHER